MVGRFHAACYFPPRLYQRFRRHLAVVLSFAQVLTQWRQDFIHQHWNMKKNFMRTLLRCILLCNKIAVFLRFFSLLEIRNRYDNSDFLPILSALLWTISNILGALLITVGESKADTRQLRNNSLKQKKQWISNMFENVPSKPKYVELACFLCVHNAVNIHLKDRFYIY